MKQIFKTLSIKSRVVIAIAACLLVITSCSKTEFGNPVAKISFNKTKPHSKRVPAPVPTPTVTVVGNTELPVTCTAAVYPIWAGAGRNDTTKATKVGSVSYSNDGINLYVTSTFSGPTCPTELQLWAGSNLASMPRSAGGVPFGQFPYKLSPAGCGTHTFTIPLSSLFPAGTTDFCNKNVYIVLHAAMGADPTVEGSTEQTAIAYGSQTFGGPRWGWIGTYPVCCPR